VLGGWLVVWRVGTGCERGMEEVTVVLGGYWQGALKFLFLKATHIWQEGRKPPKKAGIFLTFFVILRFWTFLIKESKKTP
jgi:hypothetical protein